MLSDPVLAGFAPFRTAKTLLLAVSGGPDSMALVHLARAFAADLPDPPRLIAATVDHGLRPQSRAEAESVAGWCATLGVPHRLLVWEGEKPTARLQERARHARYGLLADCARAEAAAVILTAHHADDQAETVLFRLVRGSGPAGLAGMAAVSSREGVTLGRPLLGLRKEALVEICRAADQPFVEDPSNADPRFARARLRRIAGLLAAEGLDTDTLARLAARTARAEAALVRATEDLGKLVTEQGHAGALAAAPEELVVRWLGREVAVRRDGLAPRLDRTEALAIRLVEALRAGKPLSASLGGLVLRLDTTGNLRFDEERNRRRGRADARVS